MKTYDLIIIGAGPAGITAGIYAKNFGLDCLIIGEKVGGLVNSAYRVENYPGIFNVTSKELIKKFQAHQKYLKIPFKKERVEKIKKQKNFFEIISKKNKYRAKTVILAFGTQVKKLDIKNIDKFENKGIYYRIGDDAFLPRTIKRNIRRRKRSKPMVRGLFKNKTVAVIGGANAAVMSAVMLAKEAKKVYLIYRREKLRANVLWIDRVKKCKNIEIIYNANVVGVTGKNKLKEIVLDKATPRGAQGKLKVESLFIGAGGVPNNFLIKNLGIKTDRQGYIKVDKNQTTNIPGIFAAGDITTASNEFRQIITAVAEGAIAVLGVYKYLSGHRS